MRETSNINGLPVHIPLSFAGIAPVSPSPQLFHFEPFAFLGLRACVKPGSIVFDVGASFGVITLLLSKTVGPDGHVYSFEAHEEALNMARHLVALNGSSSRVTFVQGFVGDSPWETIRFFKVKGLASVASTANPEILKFHPDAQPAEVPVIKLGAFCEAYNTYPDCIKIDVEGAEYSVLSSLGDTLERLQPDLVIETHGRETEGIKGSVEELCRLLGELEYRFFDLGQGKVTEGSEYAQTYATKIGYLLASTRLPEDSFLKRLEALNASLDQLRKPSPPVLPDLLSPEKEVAIKLMQARTLIEEGDLNEAHHVLQTLIADCPCHPEANYLLGFCLHLKGAYPQDALWFYARALELGFDEFWVRYHRGSLLLSLGELGGGYRDLKRAFELNPAHPGLKGVLR